MRLQIATFFWREHMRLITARQISVVVLAGSLAACAAVNRKAATDLASTGQTVAKETQNSLTHTRESLGQYVESLYLNAFLTGRPEPGPGELSSISRVADALRRREVVLGELARTYTAFSNLASYNAAEQVEGALGDLTGAINSYAGIVSPGTAPISAVAGSLISRGGGLLAGNAQSRSIRRGSAEIRQRVKAFQDLLGTEEHLHTAIREEINRERGKTARCFLQLRLGVPHPLLRDQLSDYGLRYDSTRYTALAAAVDRTRCNLGTPPPEGSLQGAVEAVLVRRIQRQSEAEAAIVRELRDALGSLVSAHERLERGEPVNVASLTAHLASIRTYIEELRELQTKE